MSSRISSRMLSLARTRRFLSTLFLLATVGSSAACSAILGWDPNGLACNPNIYDGRAHACLPGYSCNLDTSQCIANASRGLTQSCTSAAQCQSSQVCPVETLDMNSLLGGKEAHTCRQGCDTSLIDKGFFRPGACASPNHFCRPYFDSYKTADNRDLNLIGACVPTDACSPGSACAFLPDAAGAKNGKCVAISADANACLVGCQIQVLPPQPYQDSCLGDFICQPVGLVTQQDFTCVYNGLGAQAQGAACATVSLPCARGYVCSPDQVCALYCTRTAGEQGSSLNETECGSGNSCCAFDSFLRDPAGLTTGYCAATCRTAGSSN